MEKTPGLSSSKNGIWSLLLAGGLNSFAWLAEMTPTAQVIIATGTVVGVIGYYLIGYYDRKTGRRVIPKDA